MAKKKTTIWGEGGGEEESGKKSREGDCLPKKGGVDWILAFGRRESEKKKKKKKRSGRAAKEAERKENLERQVKRVLWIETGGKKSGPISFEEHKKRGGGGERAKRRRPLSKKSERKDSGWLGGRE